MERDTLRQALRQALLQGLLERRYVRRDALHAMYVRMAEHLGTDAAFERDLEAVRTSIAPLSLEVRACHDQVTSTAYLALINTKSDAVAQVCTPYTPAELQYIKAFVRRAATHQIHAVFHAPHDRYAVSSTHALHLPTEQPLTKQAISHLLTNLERRHWLEYDRAGTYTLAPRALQELDTYIRSDMDECVLECLACYAIVTKGQRCAHCRAAVHTSCRDAYEAGHTTCTACGAPWQHTLPVGEPT